MSVKSKALPDATNLSCSESTRSHSCWG
jgi:hypothetical protein